MTGALTKLLGGQVLRDAQTFITAFDTMFGGFPRARDATYKAAPGAWDVFPRDSPPLSRTRYARRRTSSSGSPKSGCRSPGWS